MDNNEATITFQHREAIFTTKANSIEELQKIYKKDFPIFQELLLELMTLEERRIKIKEELALRNKTDKCEEDE